MTLYAAVRRGTREEGRPIDPVCRMAVQPGDEAGVLVHEGNRYHFCSMACVRAFAADPASYADA